jgi:RNA polymerase sigma factor (TIGR02999 family)
MAEQSIAKVHERDALVAETYDHLRKIAHGHVLRMRPGDTLNTTAVVHEAYLKLCREPGEWWNDRTEFLKVASTAMRHLVVDYARRGSAGKRGGGLRPLPLDDSVAERITSVVDVLAIDEALGSLAQLDPYLERVVECRFFAGLNAEETAQVLGRSKRTVERDWARARAYLMDSLTT